MNNRISRNIVCEPLHDSKYHRELIGGFSAKQDTGYGLEVYLKEKALIDQRIGKNMTYLLIDTDMSVLVGYSSIKCGSILLHEKHSLFQKTHKEALPGVEIAQLAVNGKYDILDEDVTMGSFILSDFIFPIIRSVAEQVGVQIIYIYSLPYEDLLSYYAKYGFRRLPKNLEKQVYNHGKPTYDKGCIFMYMPIKTITE